MPVSTSLKWYLRKQNSLTGHHWRIRTNSLFWKFANKWKESNIYSASPVWTVSLRKQRAVDEGKFLFIEVIPDNKWRSDRIRLIQDRSLTPADSTEREATRCYELLMQEHNIFRVSRSISKLRNDRGPCYPKPRGCSPQNPDVGGSPGRPYLGPDTNKCIKNPLTTLETTETLNTDRIFDDDKELLLICFSCNSGMRIWFF